MLRSLLFLALATPVVALQGNPPEVPAAAATTSRRDIFQQTANLVSLAILSNNAAPANADVIRAPGTCANGEGDGCDSLAEDNEFIRSLQKKSSENREANQKEALNAFYMKNYPDVFAVSGKKMIKKPDGTFALYSMEEVSTLTQAGKIAIEYPMSKGGRIVNLTQKPVLVLNE